MDRPAFLVLGAALSSCLAACGAVDPGAGLSEHSAPSPRQSRLAWACGGEAPFAFRTTGTLEMPTECSPMTASGPGPDRGQIEQVGGDYWQADPPPGPASHCWLCTGRDQTGDIVSPPEVQAGRFLSFLVRRKVGSRTSVLLFEEGQAAPAVTLDDALGGSGFVRVVWDLGSAPPRPGAERMLRLVIRDEDPVEQIDARDFVFSVLPPPKVKVRDPEERLWGFADLHAHFFTPMAFGGQLFHGDVHSSITAQGYSGRRERSNPRLALRACNEVHGSSPDGDGVLFTLPPEGGHNRHMYPRFEGSPHFRSVYHQQAYVDWIRRAWQGGLRVVQADAVSYPFVEKIYEASRQHGPGAPRNPADDDWNFREQIEAAHHFAALPDVRDMLEIVRSPAEARAVVKGGKLAMVLGVELETLGKLDARVQRIRDERAARALIQRHLACVRERGVRHVIPVHLGENAFGAPAMYDVLFDLGNSGQRGRHFPLRATRPDEHIFYSRDVDFDQQGAGIVFLTTFQVKDVTSPPGGPQGRFGHAHAEGLTGAGFVLVQEMMRAGMIVDVEHMSAIAADQTLTLAERWGYPVISSHTGFRDLSMSPGEAAKASSWASERDRSRADLERISALGGMVGIGTGRTAARSLPGAPDCDGASPGFAARLRHAISAMHRRGVALGTDINGLGQSMAPRFGPWACWSAGEDDVRVNELGWQRAAQRGGVNYDSKVPVRRHGLERWDADGKSKRVGGREMFMSEPERRAWQAVARYVGGDGEQVDAPGDRDPREVRKYARGLWLAKNRGELSGTDAGDHLIAGAFWGCFREAAICLGEGSRAGDTAPRAPAEPSLEGDRERAARTVAAVWRSWARMRGPNAPLVRSSLGEADFDFNVDGLAHYGMLPDMLQDAKNLGITPTEMAVLFQGAEDFVSMWERAEAAAKVVNDHLPRSFCDEAPERCTCAALADDPGFP